MATISTAKCEDCKYGELTMCRKNGKKTLMVQCNKKNKEYCYGQRIDCEDMKKRSESNAD